MRVRFALSMVVLREVVGIALSLRVRSSLSLVLQQPWSGCWSFISAQGMGAAWGQEQARHVPERHQEDEALNRAATIQEG